MMPDRSRRPHVVAALLGMALVVGAPGVGAAPLDFVGTTLPPIESAETPVLSPDGGTVYAPGDDTVAVLRRNPATGVLSLLEIVRDGDPGGALLKEARSAAVSPDGSNVYVAARGDDAISIFERDPGTGALTFVRAVRDGIGAVVGLEQPLSVVVSPDGANVYAVSAIDGSLVAFTRQPASDGDLVFLEAEFEGAGGVSGIAVPNAVVSSPDGEHLYVTSGSSSLAVFDRDPGTGEIAFVQSLFDGFPVDGLASARSPVVSPDGEHVYVAGRLDDAVAIFSRDPVTGALAFVGTKEGAPLGLEEPLSLAISDDGLELYASWRSEDVVTSFTRDPATGLLTHEATLATAGVASPADDASLGISPDGTDLYAANGGGAGLPGDPPFPSVTALRLDGAGGMEVGPGYPPFRPTDSNAHSAAFGPTGDHLLVASASTDSTVVLARDSVSGGLHVADVEVGVGGFQVAVSGDGRHVYTTSIDALAVLELDAVTGDLTLVEVEVDDVSGVDGLHAPGDVAISPDDAHVYVSSRTDAAISVFSRNGPTGELDFVEAVYDGAGGITGLDGPGALALSPDGAHLYVAGAPSSTSDDSLVVFSRDPGTGALSFVEVHFEGAAGVVGLDDPTDVQVSPDGAQVYVASVRSRGVAVFARTPATGALTFLGHVSDDDPATSVGWPSALAFRSDGSVLYVASLLPDLGRVSAYARDPATGDLVLIDQEEEGRSGAMGVENPRDVLVSPDDRHVYVAASKLAVLEPGFSGCGAAPMSGCRTGERSNLSIRESIVPQKRSVRWSLSKGDQTDPEDFDPGTTNHLALCVWDESGPTPTLALRALVPADPDCSEVAGKAGCWKTVGEARFKYRDAFETPEGVKSAKLAAGESGKTAIKLDAKGEHLGPVSLPLGLPVRVQLQAANGACWEAVYASSTKSDGSRFKAKSP